MLPLIVALVRGPHKPDDKVIERLRDGNAGVRCPACGWRPRKDDLWACNPGCGYAWHTFDTGGTCPACFKQWTATQCIKCGQWSDHDAWYERSDRS